jgi:hypothetical protein
MAQPVQVKSGLPSGEYSVIDNAAAPVTITPNLVSNVQVSNGQTGLNSDKATLGFDTIAAPGAVGQGLNSFGDTGTVLLDSVNDVAVFDPTAIGLTGNPVSLTVPTPKVLTTVLNDSRQAVRVLFKNPA